MAALSQGRDGGPRSARLPAKVALAVALPLALLGLTELSLRLAGVEPSSERRVSWCKEHAVPEPPFFPVYEADGVRYRLARTESQPHPWPAEKGAGVVRVVALGGSAVHGYGFTRSGAWPDLLEERLAGAWRDREVEVLNLGTIAWSAQQVLVLGTQVLAELDPDLLVVAAGNNELLEWLGARRYLPPGALRRWVWTVTWSRRLRSSAIYSGLASILDAQDHGVWGQTDFSDDEPLAREARAPLGERGRAFAERNFHHDIGRLIERAHEAEVPVLLVAPPVNLRYQPPTWEEDAEGAEAELERAVRALADGHPYQPSARGWAAHRVFAFAEALYEQEHPWAEDWYWRTLERDPAPNRVLPRVRARALSLPADAHLDAHLVVAGLGPDPIVGYERIFDHCHPDPTAHAAIADAIAERVLDELLPGEQVRAPPPRGLDAWLGMEGDYVRDPGTERRAWWVEARASPSTPEAWLRLATVVWHTAEGHCHRGNSPCLQEGFDAAREAVELDPDLCAGWAALGRMGFAIDHLETAPWLSRALSCDPSDARSGWYLRRLERRRAAAGRAEDP
jgi:lysophospholipase L1-like esterase